MKLGMDACISSRITTVIHVISDHQINYNCFNEPFAVSPYRSLYWDMHGLIFETSIWLLAGSTRFLQSQQWIIQAHSRMRFNNDCCTAIPRCYLAGNSSKFHLHLQSNHVSHHQINVLHDSHFISLDEKWMYINNSISIRWRYHFWSMHWVYTLILPMMPMSADICLHLSLGQCEQRCKSNVNSKMRSLLLFIFLKNNGRFLLHN